MDCENCKKLEATTSRSYEESPYDWSKLQLCASCAEWYDDDLQLELDQLDEYDYLGGMPSG